MWWWPLFLYLCTMTSDGVSAERRALMDAHGDFLPHVRLAKDLLDKTNYDLRVRPVLNHTVPTVVEFSMSLYQILAINEKLQNVDLNVWVIQKWHDDFLGWNPAAYGMINTTILPYDAIWLPDTYLYNSVVMNREESERYINVVVSTKWWEAKRGAEIKFMYPALYRTTCRLDIRYFPYDQQNCTLTISSWTSSKSDIDYVAEFSSVNLDNFIANEEWMVVSFEIRRVEQKFVCCPEPWVLLQASLVVRRKPLYYIVNLVLPTSVITLVAVTGFFTAASTSSERREKLSLGIDSLLAMSILMMMVSEQMPTTSDYIPLFGLFYLTIIFIIFIGTLFTAFILNVHLQKIYARPVPPLVSWLFFQKCAQWLNVRPPTSLLEVWIETGVEKSKRKAAAAAAALDGKPSQDEKNGAAAAAEKRAPLAAVDDNNSESTMLADGDLATAQRQVAVPKARLLAKTHHHHHGGGGYKPPPLPIPKPATTAAAITSNWSTDPAVIELRLRRRFALEWEFLAVVLDRLLLILFSLVVFVVTTLMILVGEAMHISYELNLPTD